MNLSFVDLGFGQNMEVEEKQIMGKIITVGEVYPTFLSRSLSQ